MKNLRYKEREIQSLLFLTGVWILQMVQHLQKECQGGIWYLIIDACGATITLSLNSESVR